MLPCKHFTSSAVFFPLFLMSFHHLMERSLQAAYDSAFVCVCFARKLDLRSSGGCTDLVLQSLNWVVPTRRSCEEALPPLHKFRATFVEMCLWPFSPMATQSPVISWSVMLVTAGVVIVSTASSHSSSMGVML